MRKLAIGVVDVLRGLGIIAVIAVVLALHIGAFQFAAWVATVAPWWLTVPLTLIGGCYLVVRGIAWLDRPKMDQPTENDFGKTDGSR